MENKDIVDSCNFYRSFLFIQPAIGGGSKLKTALNLLNEITDFGFDQRKTLICIDKILDKKLGIGCRKPLSDEELPNAIYDSILGIFCGESRKEQE